MDTIFHTGGAATLAVFGQEMNAAAAPAVNCSFDSVGLFAMISCDDIDWSLWIFLNLPVLAFYSLNVFLIVYYLAVLSWKRPFWIVESVVCPLYLIGYLILLPFRIAMGHSLRWDGACDKKHAAIGG